MRTRCISNAIEMFTKDSDMRKVLAVLVPVLLLSGLYSSASAQLIAGKVSDAISGLPIVNASVTVVEVPKTYATDTLGKFVTDTLSKGTYTVRVEAPQYLKQSKTVILASPTEAGASYIELDLKLYSLATSTDTAGPKAGNLSVQYFFRGHSDVEISICDPSGTVVRKAFDRSRLGGTHTYTWDGKDNAGKPAKPGMYTCKLRSGNLYAQRALEIPATPAAK
jgi:hypothetical protein